MPENIYAEYGGQNYVINNLTSYIPFEQYKETLWNNGLIDPKPVKLEFKAENWPKPKPKKKKEVVSPAGYRLITDENYIIKEGDKFYIGCWRDYTFVDLNNFLGKVIGNKLGQMMDMFKNQEGFYIASKEPRFKDCRPFPWGY